MERRVLPSLAVVLTCALAGCAHEEPLPPPDVLPPDAQSMPESGRFVLTGIRNPIVALVTPTGIQGPDVNLGRYPDPSGATSWRGTAFGRDVNLTIKADAADGIVARSPFNLNVTPAPDGMVVNGLIGGLPSTVTISKSRINGAFGRCGYDIRFQGQAYVGPRNCGAAITQVGLTLPTLLATWPDAEVATVLSLMLSGR
jgi:predicted small lipoprotein YifL